MLKYETPTPNDPLLLHRGKLEFECNSAVAVDDGTITMRWLPSPSIIIEVKKAKTGLNAMIVNRFFRGDESLSVRFPADVAIGIGTPGSVESDGDAPSNGFREHLAKKLSWGDGRLLKSVRLHGVNLRRMLIVNHQDPEMRNDPVIALAADGWEARISPSHQGREFESSVAESGGFGITHLVDLSRLDHGSFDSKSAEEFALCLFYFLTFVEGRLVNAILPLGFDENGIHCWSTFAPWHVDGWKDVYSWVDQHHGESISLLFPGFYSKWQDPAWRKALQLAVPWYAVANRNDSGLENCVVLAATALDALSWQILVKTGGLSKNKFKELSAVDRLRKVSTEFGIAVDFSSCTAEVQAIAKSIGWKDIPAAIVDTRNAMVHPESNLRDDAFENETQIAAWKLAVWLIEMVLLRSFGYHGSYSDRRTMPNFVGSVVPVPWR